MPMLLQQEKVVLLKEEPLVEREVGDAQDKPAGGTGGIQKEGTKVDGRTSTSTFFTNSAEKFSNPWSAF
jgi:hypothetical protein